MKPITKEEALQKSVELWDWLADNPGAQKEDWPGWKKYRRPGEFRFCFACLYKNTHKGWACDEECIIPVFRPEEKIVFNCGCTTDKSPYILWGKNTEDRTKHAREIADSAREELRREKC